MNRLPSSRPTATTTPPQPPASLPSSKLQLATVPGENFLFRSLGRKEERNGGETFFSAPTRKEKRKKNFLVALLSLLPLQ